MTIRRRQATTIANTKGRRDAAYHHDRQERFAIPQRPADSDPLNRRETLELVRAYYRIADPVVRHQIATLIRSLAK